MVNEDSVQPASGEWTQLITPQRPFDSTDGGCLKFDYRSRFVDLDVYLLMTSSSTSHSSHRTPIVDVRHDGQVRVKMSYEKMTSAQKPCEAMMSMIALF